MNAQTRTYRPRYRNNRRTTSPDVLVALLIAALAVTFIVTLSPWLLPALVVAAAAFAALLHSARSVILFPAASGCMIWALTLPAVVTGEQLHALVVWAIFATVVACSLTAMGAAAGMVVDRVVLQPARTRVHGNHAAS